MHVYVTWALLALAAVVFAFGLWVDGRTTGRFAKVGRYGFFVQVFGLASAYFLLRPGAGVDGREAYRIAHSSGVPVLLDMYSNY